MIRKTVVALLGIAFVVTGFTGTASAETRLFSDTWHETSSGMDIHTVRVDLNQERLVVTTSLRELRRNGIVAVFIDTRPERRAPEFEFIDGHLYRAGASMEGWTTVSGPLNCDYSPRRSYVHNTLRVWISQDCLGHPGRVRVATWAGTRPDFITDLAPDQEGTYYPWTDQRSASELPCVSIGEYQQVTKAMTRAATERIFGTTGYLADGGAGGFSKGYRECRGAGHTVYVVYADRHTSGPPRPPYYVVSKVRR